MLCRGGFETRPCVAQPAKLEGTEALPYRDLDSRLHGNDMLAVENDM